MRSKLSALWTSVMFLYVYNDYFQLWQPGTIGGMAGGRMPPFGAVTQPVLLGTSLLLVVPSVMIFLSAALPHRACRRLTIVVGAAYTVVEVLTVPGSWWFYQVSAVIEAALTALAVRYAWRWKDDVAG